MQDISLAFDRGSCDYLLPPAVQNGNTWTYVPKMRLSHGDFDRLQRFLLELYEYRDLEAFRQALPGFFLRLIPADHSFLVSYDLNPANGRAKMVDCLESEPRILSEVVPHWEQSVWQHPFTRYFLQGGQMTALMFSDFFSSAQLRKSQYWELICKVLRYDRNITLPVIAGRGTSAVGLGRRRRDFTERDRLMLNLLRPHFDQAYRNAELATARSKGFSRSLDSYGLRPRESEVGGWLAQGKTNPEIAIILGISPRTVEKHMERILEKLGVENRAAAAVLLANSVVAK
jgi:DNA-binding CsgD family transcriptional regulator